MDPLQERLLKLVEGLFVDNETKQRLAERIQNQGATKEIIDDVQRLIARSVEEYEDELSQQMILLEKEVVEAELHAKRQRQEEQKNIQQERDQKQLEEVRKKLQKQI